MTENDKDREPIDIGNGDGVMDMFGPTGSNIRKFLEALDLDPEDVENAPSLIAEIGPNRIAEALRNMGLEIQGALHDRENPGISKCTGLENGTIMSPLETWNELCLDKIAALERTTTVEVFHPRLGMVSCPKADAEMAKKKKED